MLKGDRKQHNKELLNLATKKVWCQCQHRQIDQRNKIESPEIGPHIFRKWTFFIMVQRQRGAERITF